MPKPTNSEAEDREMLRDALQAFRRGAPQPLHPSAVDVCGIVSSYFSATPPEATAAALDAGVARWCAQNDIDLRP